MSSSGIKGKGKGKREAGEGNEKRKKKKVWKCSGEYEDGEG